MNRSVKLSGVIKAFEESLRLREPHEPRHGDRVARLVIQLAREVKYPGDLVELETAARLHDVGKVGVKGAVLAKAGPLNDGEWAMMKEHPKYSRDILLKLEIGDLIPRAAYEHQENFDGSGYPEGKVGEQICVEARLIRVVDVYDALITDRAYRKGYDHESALAILEEYQHNFDPDLLHAFQEMDFPRFEGDPR